MNTFSIYIIDKYSEKQVIFIKINVIFGAKNLLTENKLKKEEKKGKLVTN